MATEDAILLRLIISGQSPQEIQRLAASTQGELNDRLKVYLDHLTQLHQQAATAQTAEAVKASKAQIDAAEKQVDAVAKVMRANEIAANRSANAWKGTLEVMENIATSATFMYGILASGAGRLKELGDSIDKVTNVYGALKGSIDEMREASRGEVSDFDLITTKNRALEKELQLTDKQFGLVASAADNFADSIGENTKEALDKLVDGLAQGRLRTLAMAGVVINADDAYARYAKSIGVATDQLNDHGKKMAVIQAALDLLAKKNKDAGVGIDDFSHKWEKMTAEINNATDSLKLFVGTLAVDVYEGLTKGLPFALGLGMAKMKDVMSLGMGNFEKEFLAKIGHEDDSRNAVSALAKQGSTFRPYGQEIDPNSFLHPGGIYGGAGDRDASINAAKVKEDAAKAEAAQKKRDEIIAIFDNFLIKAGGGAKGYDNSDVIMAQHVQTPAELAVSNAYDPGGSTRAAPGGLSNSYARAQALAKANDNMQANIARSMEANKETNDLSSGVDSKGALDRMEKALKDAQEKADDLKKRAGDGLLSDIIFGKDGPMGMKDKLHTFAQDAADALGMVSDAGHKMGEALGASLAAFVSGDKSKRASIRQTTHDILEALATQAYSRAIFETAEGLASLALGPIGGVSAGMHFAAAGMFAAVGTTAALGARATGVTNAPTPALTQDQKFQNQADTAAAKKQWDLAHGISTSTSGSGGFGSNGVRSSPANNNGAPLTINLTVLPGGEAEAGRQINKALNAYYSTTGQGVPAAMVTG